MPRYLNNSADKLQEMWSPRFTWNIFQPQIMSDPLVAYMLLANILVRHFVPQLPKGATIFFWIGGSWISERTSAIFLWPPYLMIKNFYDTSSGASTMLKKHVTP